ncbi:von Willebrand factor C domain-containing protein 2-like [Haliotis rufescens]|uniref:von Willebrand factor C domain-containing protein 2-like n=1 Tax=Haliotis rufescens TaxID=6454 RepID=UPI00201EC284|nr:von Willebrand factor C domain-containing protein 2-like [Haliotis rufescens]
MWLGAVLLGLLLNAAPTEGSPVQGCQYGVQFFHPGQKFMKNECEPCVCDVNQGISCVALMCQDSACVDPFRTAGECCTVCPNGPNCRHGNQVIPAGQETMIGGLTCNCPDVKSYPPETVDAICV